MRSVRANHARAGAGQTRDFTIPGFRLGVIPSSHHALRLGKHQCSRVLVVLTIVFFRTHTSRHCIPHALLQAVRRSSQARAAAQADTGRWTWPGSSAPHALAAHASSSMAFTVTDKKP